MKALVQSGEEAGSPGKHVEEVSSQTTAETIYRVTLELLQNGSSSTLLPVLSCAKASEAAAAAVNTVSGKQK